MPNKNQETFYPKSRSDWRKWLEENHDSQESVWLIFYKKKTGIDSISWTDAVEEALCFGWIDSKKQSIDAASYQQFFSRRKPNSTWSKVNKDKVIYLIAQNLMKEAGLACIEIAKQNGSWTLLDSAEQLLIPEDLEKEFGQQPHSKAYFLSLSKSKRKHILSWIALAKRAETRAKRIGEIAEEASKQQLPKQFLGKS
ncbi:YdeI/OmpD-associated family protein [Saprospira sp. CCB-QB6]|uniref:YdeI/OmpD-associated family protein n=1 Tax=Saprospira sp. CCB-QB6 TaxID=3023936 RepID=UPI002349E7BF|nr:YdeI/OmpD-associated family protein [Saprospira sp. CCB-QB6]WCL81672.1 YdeI/OmpD-associated family protein [Saprospira sp. CCB-QB6]